MILIIDDDAAVRSSLTFLLKRAGFEPEAVPGPEEALVVVRQTTLQLILMDMNFTQRFDRLRKACRLYAC